MTSLMNKIRNGSTGSIINNNNRSDRRGSALGLLREDDNQAYEENTKKNYTPGTTPTAANLLDRMNIKVTRSTSPMRSGGSNIMKKFSTSMSPKKRHSDPTSRETSDSHRSDGHPSRHSDTAAVVGRIGPFWKAKGESPSGNASTSKSGTKSPTHSKLLTSMKVPTIQLPNVQLPNVQLPNVQIPSFGGSPENRRDASPRRNGGTNILSGFGSGKKNQRKEDALWSSICSEDGFSTSFVAKEALAIEEDTDDLASDAEFVDNHGNKEEKRNEPTKTTKTTTTTTCLQFDPAKSKPTKATTCLQFDPNLAATASNDSALDTSLEDGVAQLLIANPSFASSASMRHLVGDNASASFSFDNSFRPEFSTQFSQVFETTPEETAAFDGQRVFPTNADPFAT